MSPRVLLAVVLSFSAAARADATWGLKWQAPDSCVQAAELVRRVEQSLGRSVFAVHPLYFIDGQVREDEGGWTARLIVVGDKGQVAGSREVTSTKDCDDLVARVTLVISLLIKAPPTLETPVAKEPLRVPLATHVVTVERGVPAGAWVLIGTGAAFLAAGGIGLGYSLSKYDQLQPQRVGIPNPVISVSSGELETLRWLYPTSWASAICGFVAVTAGLSWYLFGDSEVIVSPGPGTGASVLLRF